MAIQTAIDHLEVRWRVKDSGEAWGKVYRVGVFAEIVVERLDPEKVYEFEYRSVSSCGAKSAWGGADHTAPALPAGTINLADVATNASDAGAAAAAAQTDADTANTALANIASDNLLTAGEKPTVIRDWNVISAEQAGIDAQATAYGITTQKTAYDNAVTALSSYLGTLTTPVLWSNLTGNTTIVGTTFRSKFADVYATRQTLLNAIYAAAKVRADNAQTAANSALDAADAAQTDATASLNMLDDIAADGKLTAGEKVKAKQEYGEVIGEQAGIDAQAAAYSITTEKSTYDTAITSLKNYLRDTVGVLDASNNWTSITGTTGIARSTWDSKWTTVYTSRQALLNKIYGAAQALANNAQGTADSAASAASAAQTAADNAQADADTANTALGNIASDNVLTQGGEKSAVILDYSNITSEQAGIDAQATAYAITTEKTSYDNAVSALTTYLNGLTTPTAWNSQTGNTAIVGGTFRSKFSAVYSTRQTLLNKIYALAKAKADNAQGAGDAAQESADAAQVSADQVNVINPGFDSGDRGWTKEGNWTIKTDGAGPGQGIGYAEHVGSSTYPTVAIRNNARCLVIVGQTYKVQALIRGISANGSCYARICWRDLSGAELSFANGNSVTGSATAGSFAIGQAPSGAVYANAEIVASGHTSGTYRADNVVSTLQPSHVGEVPDGGGRFAVNQVDGNGLAVIDFSQAGHVNKNLDNLADGGTYGRPLKSRLNAGNPLIDFSAGYHLNKNADYIGESAARKWAAESGANITETRTAADTAHVAGATAASISDGAGRAQLGFDGSGYLVNGRHSLDLLADGGTYARARASGLQSGVVTGLAYGANKVPNPSFVSNLVGAPAGISLQNQDVCDGWAVGAVASQFSVIRSGAALLLRIPSGAVLPANSGAQSVIANTVAAISINGGATYRLFARLSVSRGSNVPAGVGLIVRSRVAWYDAADVFISESFIDSNGATGSFTHDQSFTAPSNTVRAVVTPRLYYTNSNASAVTTSGIICDATWSFVSLSEVLGLDSDIQDGTTYARIKGAEMTGGIHKLGIAGSGRRLGDARNQVMVSIGNYGAGWSGLSISYTSTTTSATITASAATMQVGGNPVAYNQSSVTVSGTTDTQVRHYLYYDDAAYAGGSQTLHATTNQLTAQAGDGRAFVGSMLISFPASGTGSGTGSGPCPDENAWVLRADPHGARPDWPVRAKEVRTGHFLRLTDGRAGLVTYSERKPADRVRVTSHHHRTLTCSTSAPLELARADGECVIAPDSLGEWVRVKQRGVAASPIAAEVIRVEDAGPGYVQHITCQNACFWTGDDPDYLFGHHNMKQTT